MILFCKICQTPTCEAAQIVDVTCPVCADFREWLKQVFGMKTTSDRLMAAGARELWNERMTKFNYRSYYNDVFELVMELR